MLGAGSDLVQLWNVKGMTTHTSCDTTGFLDIHGENKRSPVQIHKAHRLIGRSNPRNPWPVSYLPVLQYHCPPEPLPSDWILHVVWDHRRSANRVVLPS
jgi:hypothetical protein